MVVDSKGTFHGVRVAPNGLPERDSAGNPILEGEAVIQITRKAPGCWRFDKYLGYRSADGREFAVPHDLNDFDSDLMSMPWPFAWLVPGTGKHIPGVLIHDGLVVKLNDDGTRPPPTHVGPSVNREEADALLREALQFSGTTFLRRWLMWTGVMLGTIWATFRPRVYWRAMLIAYFGAIALLGFAATMDLFDAGWDPPLLGQLWPLPWMDDRSWWVELLAGAVGSVAFPTVGALLFLKRYKVGLVSGLWFAVLLHVTVLVVIVYSAYRTFDRTLAKFAKPGALAL